MAFIPLPNGIRVAMEYEWDGSLVVNVFHYTRSTPIVVANLTAIAELMADWWIDGFNANFSVDIAMARVVATDVSVANGAQWAVQPASPVAGEYAGDSVPNNSAFVTSYSAGLTGRSFRGRTYWGGIGEGEVEGSYISSARAAGIMTELDAMWDDATAAGFIPVIASYQTAGAPRTIGLGTPITTIAANFRMDSQRRRLPGIGA